MDLTRVVAWQRRQRSRRAERFKVNEPPHDTSPAPAYSSFNSNDATACLCIACADRLAVRHSCLGRSLARDGSFGRRRGWEDKQTGQAMVDVAYWLERGQRGTLLGISTSRMTDT